NQLCGGSEDVQGLDLLSLDVREAYMANGTGMVDLLIGFQLGKAAQDQTVKVFYNAGSAAKTIEIKGKTEGPFNSTSCDKVVGPSQFPGADAHVKAIDCYVSYAHLGVNGTGSKLTGIHLESDVGTV